MAEQNASPAKLHYRGYALSASASLAAALFFIPYKKGLETTSPETFILAVYIIGFGINVLGGMAKKEKLKFNTPTIVGAIIFASVSVLGNFAIGKALEGITPSITTVMIRTQIILVMFAGWLLLKEKLNAWLIPGGAVALLGFIGMNYNESNALSGDFIYYLWGICAAASFGSSQILVKLIIHRINPITLNHLRLLLGFFLLLLFPGAYDGLFQLGWFEWALAAVSAFFGPSLSRVLQMYALRYIQVSQSILFSMMTPIFALFLSWVYLGTVPSLQQIAGAAVIMAGITIPIVQVIRSQNQKESLQN